MIIGLGIYAGTTILAWYSAIKYRRVLDKRLKDDGYKYIKNRKYNAKEILKKTFEAVALSFPILNIMFIFGLKPDDQAYNEHKNNLLDEGLIIGPDKDNNISSHDPDTVVILYPKKPTIMDYLPHLDNAGNLVKGVDSKHTREIYTPMFRSDDDYISSGGRTFTKDFINHRQ